MKHQCAVIVFSVCAAMCLFGLTLHAIDDVTRDDLQRRQAEIAASMQARRAKMMRENSELKRLQEEKYKIHRKILIILDADPELYELQKSFADIDQELLRLHEKKSAAAQSVRPDSARVDSPRHP